MASLAGTLRSRRVREWVWWNGRRWGVLVNGKWLYVSELEAGLGREDCKRWVRQKMNEEK